MGIIVSGLSKSFGGEDVLKDVTFTLNPGERIGLVGKNGSGKSTLLRLIAGLEEKDAGRINIPRGSSIGYIPQVADFLPEMGVKAAVRFGIPVEDYQADSALSRFGLEDLGERKVKELSSGQRTRIYLARISVIQSDFLLLDEPTNHLDVEAMEWLEGHLLSYRGGLLLVSHDRRFLDRLAVKILDLENSRVKVYGGNYTSYLTQKELEREGTWRQYQAQQKEINRLRADLLKKKEKASSKKKMNKEDNFRYSAGFYSNRLAGKFGAQAKSLETRLERMEMVEKPGIDPELRTMFRVSQTSGEVVVKMEDISKSFKGSMVLRNLNLLVRRGERLAISGVNGSGKSTLLKVMLGELSADSGSVELGSNVVIGYLDQEQRNLDPDNTVLDEVMNETGLSRSGAYKLLMKFLITPEMINQKIASLSSGERAKVSLAKIMASGANLIVLDEPTNHLDISSREALEEALVSYDGTLVVISHDRYFLDVVGLNLAYKIKDGLVSQV